MLAAGFFCPISPYFSPFLRCLLRFHVVYMVCGLSAVYRAFTQQFYHTFSLFTFHFSFYLLLSQAYVKIKPPSDFIRSAENFICVYLVLFVRLISHEFGDTNRILQPNQASSLQGRLRPTLRWRSHSSLATNYIEAQTYTSC